MSIIPPFPFAHFMTPSEHGLSRRQMLQVALAGAGLGAVPSSAVAASGANPGSSTGAAMSPLRAGFAIDDLRVRLYTPAVSRPVKLLMLADTHLFRDDARGAPFREFSGRMAKAYNQTRHFRTKEATQPETCFVETLKAAQESHVEGLILAGDIFSFPSEAAIEWVQAQLAPLSIPWRYTAGNHDWHYEGMAGTSAELRTTWSSQRLSPMYQGGNPLMSTLDAGGVRVVILDNSTYEIQPEQLEFFRQHVASSLPLILMVHIPLYAPGRAVGFGCGHPSWGAKVDKGFGIERRPPWRSEGHTQITMDFHREVFAAPNMLGVFAGHIHQPSLDVLKGIPQIVAGANATGAHLLVEILPPPTV